MQEKNIIDQLKSIISKNEERVKQLEKELDIKTNSEFYIHGTKSATSAPFYNINNIKNNKNDTDYSQNIPDSNIGFMCDLSDLNNLTDHEIDRNIISMYETKIYQLFF